MNCWHCNENLIWGGDHDMDDEDTEFSMVTNLSCPKCAAFVEVYLPREEKQNHKQKLDEKIF